MVDDLDGAIALVQGLYEISCFYGGYQGCVIFRVDGVLTSNAATSINPGFLKRSTILIFLSF